MIAVVCACRLGEECVCMGEGGRVGKRDKFSVVI